MSSFARILSWIFAGTMLAGCSPTGTPSPSDKPPTDTSLLPESKPETHSGSAFKPDSESMFGSTFDLLPVGSGGQMEAVIVDLKKNFAADQQAVELLSRMYGNLSVKLDVIEPDRRPLRGQEPEESKEQPDRWMTPPPPGFPVLVRIAFDRLESQSYANGKTSTRLVGVTLGGVALIKFPMKPADKAGRIEGAESIDPVLLAVNDYLLRKQSGYLLFQYGQLFPKKLHDQLGKDLSKYREYLDTKIEGHTKAFQGFWSDRNVAFK